MGAGEIFGEMNAAITCGVLRVRTCRCEAG